MPYLVGIALGLLLTLVGTALLYPFVTIGYHGFGPGQTAKPNQGRASFVPYRLDLHNGIANYPWK